jgi:hypothetical protein
MAVATIDFYKKDGTRTASVNGLCSRTWVLNQYGQAEFTMPYTSSAATQEVCEFGNYVLVYSDTDAIPVWGGIIEPPRRWTPGGLVLKLYSCEYIMQHRFGPKKLVLKGKAGDVVSQIIQFANGAGDTRIRMGDVFLGGTDREETINPTPLYDDIVRVMSRAALDWEIQPDLSQSGVLFFKMNVRERIGSDVTAFRLEEGKNLELTDEPLVEEGELFNSLLGYGDGSDWNTRVTSLQKDQSSIDRYGLREHAKNFSGNKNQSTLDENTVNWLNKYSQPRYTYSVNVLDPIYNKPTFVNIRLGNTIPIKVNSYGFAKVGNSKQYGSTGIIKVYGMGYNEDVGKMQIVATKDSEDDTNA